MSKIIQDQFIKFHDNIRLDVEDNQQLADKRNMLINEIRAYLQKKSEDEGEPLITFEEFNQGSYAMGTGNQAAFEEDDYDIDVGLSFFISKDKFDPIEVKGWIHDALDKKEFRTVEWKNACIRVQYTEQGYHKFHVDFACYSDARSNSDSRNYLGKGKPSSKKEDKKWEKLCFETDRHSSKSTLFFINNFFF